ncbi:hypothetical protein CEE37_07840 [candidate division LCP-89 bacterium B3_LCP]|uniref:Uncharacterized protein n=1 Tax=candidate division LCP-89 bacterium B3_LCP TaxID=2012998 RepID=A0A532UZS2_UNCL8|nr:MAG: hypothetical protein CEE37_07840 [candidate division LCP-89 bacterium B3_LCP]
MDKKGIELSINFLVIIIISLIVFGFGARFIYQLGSEAVKLQSMTVEELDRKIGILACEGSERVCFGFDRKIIKRGKLGVFGLRIINILDNQDFDVLVSRPTPSGYTKKGEDIVSDNLIVKPESRSVYIQKNEEKDLAIGVEVPKDARAGIYIFDVRVMPYEALHKIYVEVP